MPKKTRLAPDSPYDATFSTSKPVVAKKKTTSNGPKRIQVSFPTSSPGFRPKVTAAARWMNQSVAAVLEGAFDRWLKEQPADLRKFVENAATKHGA